MPVISDIAFVRYAIPDLDRMEQFLSDFGLHTAFEVIDLDDLMQGQAYLKARNYEHAWGVGRHIQGSQIFDYWRDPWGNKHEHWTDGDLVNRHTPAGLARFSANELAQWAPTLEPSFFR